MSKSKQEAKRERRKKKQRDKKKQSRKAIVRTCGSCTVCCHVLGVPSIEKESWVDCTNLCESGCSVYDKRPIECSVFECGWLKKFGSNNARPDKLGVIFATDKNNFGMTINAYVIRENAHREPKAQRMINELRQHAAVVIIPGKEGARKVLPVIS